MPPPPGPEYQPVPSTDDLHSADSTDELHHSASYPPHQSLKALSTKAGGYSKRKVFLLLAAFCVVAFGSYKLGQWSFGKSGLKDVQTQTETDDSTLIEEEKSSDTPVAQNNTSDTDTDMAQGPGKLSVGYFVNWGIYGRKYPPQLIPANDLTHILYAFANVRSDSGEVFLSDLWADQDIHYPGDSWSDPGGPNLYGNFKAIYLLKQQNRHLKVLLSIGGWTYSPSFHPVVVDPAKRKKFAESAVKLVEDYGIDGLDVDYEYPQTDEQARGYVELLREVREGLDGLARRMGADYHFPLTIAAPCGPQNYEKLYIREMDQYLDFWNMMAYDFSGSWDSIANHQANLYNGPISASTAINYYISHGLAPSKIVLGIPLYGRSFLNTQGPGTPFSGIGTGSWEAGVYDYRALPLSGSYIFKDEESVASWTYDYDKREMISFDDEGVGRKKGEWIAKMGLAGSMFWELSGNKGEGLAGPREPVEGGGEEGKKEKPGRSLVGVVKEGMGGVDLQSQNWLRYEGSKFENLRKGMPQ